MAADAIWIDFAGSIADSKMTPAFVNASVGSPTTARNWNTVRQLDALARSGPRARG